MVNDKIKLESSTTNHDDNVEKKKLTTEKMIDDVVRNIKEMQVDLENKISEYGKKVPSKLNIDLIESGEMITVKTDLPGVNKEDINIELAESSLTIIAKFEEKIEVEDVNYLRKERKYGEALRSVNLPVHVIVEEASANFENGVLTINLPKAKKKKFNVEID